MKTFFKTFFAAFLALIVFCLISIGVIIAIISGLSADPKPKIGKNAVLVIDLSNTINEQAEQNELAELFGNTTSGKPGLYDIIRMLRNAKSDTSIKALYIKAGNNINGLATNQELRNAILDFKKSEKPVWAYGEAISQVAYYTASAADKIYCHPQGGVEWKGFTITTMFFKNLLDRLDIEPEIFYAGKFKSATEPLRATSMTDANRLQTTAWLNDVYDEVTKAIAISRKKDTGYIRQLANTAAIRSAADAIKYGLCDGAIYEDEVQDLMRKSLQLKSEVDINFVSISKYFRAADFKATGGNYKIAIIYAQGDVQDGKGDDESIGSEAFVKLIRNARTDDDVKAIVFRINSPGGSSLASDAIWREVMLARRAKPFIVSMGDMAASGGYYIAVAADSIFAQPTTITGSIGVFSIYANLKDFFSNKLGITYDGVKTAPYADLGSTIRPLTDFERMIIQNGVDSIYQTFKKRVSVGRLKHINAVDSIAQGRVWTGNDALGNGLVDRIGGLQDAVNCAAKMAKLNDYRTREYPEPKSIMDQIMTASTYNQLFHTKPDFNTETLLMLKKTEKLKAMIAVPQAKLPFDFIIE